MDVITSAFPELYAYSVEMTVLFELSLTIIKLGGITESAPEIAYLVYLSVASLFVLIINWII